MSITREGKRFLLAVIIIGFAALNTGNNLIYLIFSMMLSILLLSLVLPYLNLKRLNIEFVTDEPLYAGTPSSLSLIIKNLKKFLPSFSFWFSIPTLQSESLYVESIKPSSSKKESLKISFPFRGLYTVKETELSSEFPFIFFSLRKSPEGRAEILVYPKVYDVTKETNETFRAINGLSRPITGKSEDILKIRQFRYGDEVKNIHWKATARTSKLMIKEFSLDEPERVTIFFDNYQNAKDDHFEKAISFTASLSVKFIQLRYTVRLVTCRKTVPFGSGSEHLYKILDLLAVIQQSTEVDCLIEDEIKGLNILVLSSESSPLRRFAPVADKIYYASTL